MCAKRIDSGNHTWYDAMNTTSLTRRAGFWRASRLNPPVGHYHEWIHFVVLHPRITVILNFALQWTPPSEGWRGTVTILAKSSRWRGEVAEFGGADLVWQSGGMDCSFGDNVVSFGADGWRIRTRSDDVQIDLVITPTSVPAAASRLPFAATSDARWFVVPRCAVRGLVRLPEIEVDMSDGTAYHDHNWGEIRWGGDFAWEWQFWHSDGQPAWTAVSSQLLDRDRHVCRQRGLMLWAGSQQVRAFSHSETSISFDGHQRVPMRGTFPAPLALTQPRAWEALPTTWRVEAARGLDFVRLDLRPETVCQVLVPDGERLLGIVAIQEIEVAGELTGEISGQSVRARGRGIGELVRAR